MPLDQFKTQILLLHSEQATLDNLSSGFSDSYTVHCATSGSEALQTLVETPINIIVTAQDLPGMSGLDALREAKKRSPDTIGILLAGNSANEIEALVGDEEVFQVVRGNVSGDALLKLVENAARQNRLMALAESANDTVASVDQPAQHIVMETSENGATIISDGTGRMPALDPKKVSAATGVGSRAVDILVLTHDMEFLETIKDSSRGMHKVYYAKTLAQANEAIGKHKIGVAVVDASMVGDKIEQLTQHLRKGSARLVSIVAGRRDDGEMLMDLINRGKVYRFLLKPVSPGRARLAVEASVKHHLEAPDAAFGAKDATSSAKPAVSKAAPPPAPKPAAAKTSPEPVVKAAVTATPDKPETPTPVDPPLGSEAGPEDSSPIEDSLAGAFGQDDGSFTETVTGLISSVGEKLSANKQPEPEIAPFDDTTESDITMPGSFEDSDGTSSLPPRILGIGAAAVAVIAAGLFWFLSGSDETTVPRPENAATPSFGEADVVVDNQTITAAPIDVDQLLSEARLARDAGQIFNPAGSNAIELYAAALAADAGNAAVTAELEGVLSQALGMAESAMLEARLDDADAALQRVASVDAQNSRLPFLTSQLSQMQLRGHLDEARSAVRESRFEDAASALGAARNLGTTDTVEIDAVTEELSAARSEQQVDDVLAKAAARLDDGALLSPSNDNARYYYELVLSNDAENAAARQGLSVIASKLAFQARTEMDNGNLDATENILAGARAVDPGNSDVSALATALRSARAAIVEQQRLAQEERQAVETAAAEEAERLERQAEADRLAAAADAETQAIEGETQASTTTTDESAGDVESQGSDGVLDGVDKPQNTPNASTAPAEQPSIVAVSSLTRVTYVAPKYPRSAQRRNQSGWVDVVFTVATDGAVTNVDVRGSTPGDTFVAAAVKAVEKWKFEPVIENGVAVTKRAGVRMLFALE